ncbi:MAG: response regulator, partial [Muribaculum sp.]
MKIKHFFITVTLMLIAIGSPAQRTKLYTSNGMLSSCLINDVYQDCKGYVWIATEYGLNRFDGTRFTTFKHTSGDDRSLRDNYVRTVQEDVRGRLLVGCITGLMEFDRATEEFKDIPLIYDEKPVSAHVSVITRLSNGDIWIGTAGYGVFIYDSLSGTARCMHHLARAAGSLLVSDIYEDATHAIWIATEDNGVCRYYPAGDHSRSYNLGCSSVGNNVSAVIGSSGGDIYVSSLDAGVSRLCPGADDFTPVVYGGGVLSVKTLALCGGALYAGTEGHGAKLVAGDVLLDVPSSSPLVEFNRSKVHRMLEDRDGNVWIGMFQKGIALVPKLRHAFGYYGRSVHENPIGDGCVMAVYVDSNHNLWVSCDNDGVYRLDPGGRRVAYYPTPTTVMCILEDSRSRMWIGSFNSGLYRVGDNGSLNEMPRFAEKKICSIVEAGEGVFYLGTFGNGLIRYNPDDDTSRELSFKVMKKEETSIGNDWINNMLYTPTGLLWIAHYQGISCYDTRSGRYVRFGDNENLVDGVIAYSLMEDHKGNIWCGTSYGIYVYDAVSGEVAHYSSSDGLPNDVICGLCEDESHNVWVSTYHGVSKFIVGERRFVNFDAGDGLQGNEFTHGAYCNDGKGIVYFGGTDGVTSFHPLDINDGQRIYTPVITGFDIFSTPVTASTLSGGRRVIDTGISEARNVRLAYDDNTFSISFSTFSYDNPDKLVYEYRVRELGKDWLTTPPGQSRVTFNNMAPGDYRFQVRVAGNTEPDALRELDITVSPPWYRSWWAILIYLGVAVFVSVCVIHFLRDKADERRRQLERRQSEQLLEAKLQFFTNISHEIRTPMTLIMSPLEKLIANCTDSVLRETYMMIFRNAQRILRLVNQLMDMRKIEKGQMQLHFSETDMVPYIEEAMRSFEYMAYENDVAFTFHHSASSLPAWIDVNNFDKVLINILSNAFKYTPRGGHIDITLTEGEDAGALPPLDRYVEIAVSDSGIGIDPDKIEKIFDRFYRIENEITGAVAGAGIGLHLCRTLVTLHHGTISARNHVGATGCEFIIRLPAGADHLTAEELQAVTARMAPGYEVPVTPLSDKNVSKNRSDITVAVVEDDVDVREYLRHELSEKYNVITFANGNEALENIIADAPEIVISDVMMPGLDGLSLCRKIKQNPNINHIPVILLSAKVENEDRMTGLQAGADSYMSKPVSMEVLMSTIAGMIANRKLLRAKFSGIQDQEDSVRKITMKSQDEVLLNRIMAVINDNLSSPDLSVERLAEEVGLSRVHLHRKLKELTNMSARDFIKNLRLKQAARLLREQKLSVAEVAYATGFSNPSHFTVACKEMGGMPPTRL